MMKNRKISDRRSFLKAAGMATTVGLGCSPALALNSKNGYQDLESAAPDHNGQIEAVYVNEDSKLTVSLERVDVLLKSTDYTLNFPGYLTFKGMDVLVYGSGQHGGPETRQAVLSTDRGSTWMPASSDSPFSDNVQNSGLHGRLKDGTYLYVGAYPLAFDWKSGDGMEKYWSYRLKEFKWNLRRFSAEGNLIGTSTMELLGLPWETVARFEVYGSILELENGDLLAAFLVTPEPANTRPRNSVVIARSSDGAKSFHYQSHFSHEVDGKLVGDVGASEPDLALLPNGDILCIMRSGSTTPLYQGRSSDGGHTWTKQVSTGWPGVKPKLKVLSNGVLICTTGRGAYGHPQVTCLMVGIDGTGDHWEAPFNFHTGPGCSYTWNIERDGKLEIIYSHSSFTKPIGTYGLPFQSIKRAVLDIKRETRN